LAPLGVKGRENWNYQNYEKAKRKNKMKNRVEK